MRVGDRPGVYFFSLDAASAVAVQAARTMLNLVERYCLYHLDRRGEPYRLDIHHPPWPL